MKDNHGFTLVELIVVMVIMGIVAIGSISAYRLLDNGNAKSAASRIMALLDYVQTQNLTKSQSYALVISLDGDGNYKASVVSTRADGSTDTELTELLKLKGGSIKFENNHGTLFDVTSSGLQISFRKDTGGVKEYAVGDTYTRILVSSSGSNYYIRLVTATGKNYLE